MINNTSKNSSEKPDEASPQSMSHNPPVADVLKSGFISIIGKPNVGKSTLLNRFVGQKLAGVSPKPQTTRQTIKGILTDLRGQAIFVDTPGIHEPKDKLGERMMRDVRSSFTDADLIFWMVYPRLPGVDEKKYADELFQSKKPVILIVNKIDTVPKLDLIPILDTYSKLANFTELFPVSARSGEGFSGLLDRTFELLPEHPLYYPDDQISEQSERFLAQEIIREKVFLLTGEEIPYASAIVINEFKERSDRLIFIDATVYVNKKSQRGILIGEKGNMIKQIGTRARRDLESNLKKRIFLQLQVKERENWKKDDQFLDKLENENR